MSQDANGNHHGHDGKFISPSFVPIRDYIERIFSEKEKLSNLQREGILRELVDAKEAVDKAQTAFNERVKLLESGGAPFASRLDESLTALKVDVEKLKLNMVRTGVLEALREQTEAEAKGQKRHIQYIWIGGVCTFTMSLVGIIFDHI